MKHAYFKINRDLAIEVALKAKDSFVKQFIFMSSIIVYGKRRKNTFINFETPTNPDNYYGESKLEAEKGISKLKNQDFKVVIIRPPMIYGKNSKGNYQKLSKYANRMIFFPDYKNYRSILHIDNLCVFIKNLIDFEDHGIFLPQNEEFSSTSDILKSILDYHGKKIYMTKLFNPIIDLMLRFSFINKIFGDLAYAHSSSKHEQKYQVVGFKDSIAISERE
jgi:UDP-glucose 4-epimerase